MVILFIKLHFYSALITKKQFYEDLKNEIVQTHFQVTINKEKFPFNLKNNKGVASTININAFQKINVRYSSLRAIGAKPWEYTQSPKHFFWLFLSNPVLERSVLDLTLLWQPIPAPLVGRLLTMICSIPLVHLQTMFLTLDKTLKFISNNNITFRKSGLVVNIDCFNFPQNCYNIFFSAKWQHEQEYSVVY